MRAGRAANFLSNCCRITFNCTRTIGVRTVSDNTNSPAGRKLLVVRKFFDCSMEDHLPFKVEYARSEFATCKMCSTKIADGSLRIARVFKSALFAGNQKNWFHAHCFFDAHRPLSVGDFDGFENVRVKHQEYIRMEIDKSTKLVEFVAKKTKVGDGKPQLLEARMSQSALRDYGVEYAKSGRAKCRQCEITIKKDELRVQKTIYDSDVGMKFGGEPLWYHLICFVKDRYQLGWLGAGDQLPGYRKLNRADQQIIDRLIRPTMSKTEGLDYVKSEVKPQLIPNPMTKRLRSQNDTYFKFRDYCQKNLTDKEMVAVLKMNHQDAPRGTYAKLEAMADLLTFGALERCPQCAGQMCLKHNTFQCRGFLSDGSPCEHTDARPDRRPGCVPAKIRAAHRVLDLDYPPKDRLFENVKALKKVKEEIA